MIFNNPNKEALFDDFLTKYMSVIDGIYTDVHQRFY